LEDERPPLPWLTDLEAEIGYASSFFALRTDFKEPKKNIPRRFCHQGLTFKEVEKRIPWKSKEEYLCTH